MAKCATGIQWSCPQPQMAHACGTPNENHTWYISSATCGTLIHIANHPWHTHTYCQPPMAHSYIPPTTHGTPIHIPNHPCHNHSYPQPPPIAHACGTPNEPYLVLRCWNWGSCKYILEKLCGALQHFWRLREGGTVLVIIPQKCSTCLRGGHECFYHHRTFYPPPQQL